ncbi:RNA pseudouridine synthase [Variovorax dokdonensis]|uniref:Dual-specificity RNA pseudouridine synthase RluF n=1 Tax=Variovorax dokdonensis TaxID=344883 RepID=A0ABT7NBB1_9BURK|nr:RNA pseudouridine synthase [Variovorax dokdonensis]MDM0045227.1 RNA pseudouridine synthase [Variovorax dokdonensis]
MNSEDPQGVRLAKRVAALAGCSRRDAELLIEGGAVRVNGNITLLPQARVLPGDDVAIEAGAKPLSVPPVTLLLHKPAGMRWEDAAALLVPANQLSPSDDPGKAATLRRHLHGQTCFTPLDALASGLMIYTQEWRVERKLTEDAAFIEHELMVDVAGEVSPQALARLKQLPFARVSISRQTPGTTGLRFAIKGLQPGQVEACCERAGLTLQAVRRIRIGPLALAALPAGQWRLLRPDERV